ncbi:MAG: radical SAM protein [Bacteroidales bacterium]|jgi:radical SAM superfamily enzyme YgiQ (UPF0313 family)|nr:radical SAM protein [Bacteroidales bacterium]
MKILLISPSELKDIEYKAVTAAPFMGIKALFAPHALAAIAALIPNNFEVKIFDEAVHGSVEEHLKTTSYNLIGIHLTTNLLKRCIEIGSHIRNKCSQSYLVAGGIGLSSIPVEKVNIFQTVFYGEAEETWPEFLIDFEKGKPLPKYRKLSHPNMALVPIPRWELISDDLKYYATVSIQTTRGCPYDCDFCNVIYTYGRKMRCKVVAQVIEEVKLLESLGVKAVFFADDNFIGNRKFVKEILKELKPLNNSFNAPLLFMTQLDITVANDDELLGLLADCNFIQLMIGIETVDEVTLTEMNKIQNLRVDIPNAVRKIQSYGILVTAHLIIGFDNDTTESFKNIENFINQVNVTEYLLHPLMAPAGTKLWYKMKRDSRIIDYDLINDDFTDIVSNVIPKNMTREELMSGMLDFWSRLNTVDSNASRVSSYIENISRIPDVQKPNFKGFWKMKGLIFNAIGFFITKADKKDKKAFFDLFKQVRKKSIILISRFMYMYTNYLMNRYRAELYSEILVQQIRIENNDPAVIVKLDSLTPIPENILTHSKEIFLETYTILRKSIDKQAKLYNTALETITDFINHFGNDFIDFDDFQKKNLATCAIRVLNNGEWKKEVYAQNEEPLLPENKPPEAFFKQMHNNLDNYLRYIISD